VGLKRVLIASFLVLAVGYVALLLFPSSTASYLNSRIKLLTPHVNAHKSAIYLIKEASLCCRPCPKYEQFQEEKKDVLFIFFTDFSDNDIDNFRFAFSVPADTKSERMNSQWEEIYKRLNRRDNDKGYSYLLVLSKKANVREIWGF
jgi:hypothetical protein